MLTVVELSTPFMTFRHAPKTTIVFTCLLEMCSLIEMPLATLRVCHAEGSALRAVHLWLPAFHPILTTSSEVVSLSNSSGRLFT